MDYSKLGYCPHVVTEDRKDAEIYCLICAPQVVASLRSSIRELKEQLANRIDIEKAAKEWADDLSETKSLLKENARLRDSLAEAKKLFDLWEKGATPICKKTESGIVIENFDDVVRYSVGKPLLLHELGEILRKAVG